MALLISLLFHSQLVTSHGRCILVRYAAAARSVQTSALVCICRYEAGSVSETFSSTVLRIISALSSPQASRNTFLALRIVFIPMVIEQGGRLSTPRLRDASLRDVLSSKIRRVVELACEPGSFIPIIPLLPIPRTAMSIPPNVWILCSYNRQWSIIASCGMLPSIVKMFCLSMSTCEMNIFIR